MLINEKVTKRLITLILVMTLLVATTGTAVLAADAMPGERLYPITKQIERAQIALTFGEIRKDSLRLEIADKRLNQINTLLNREDIDEALIELACHDLNTLLGDISTYENQATQRVLNNRNELLIARINEVFSRHVELFEQHQAKLEQELAASLEGETTRDAAAIQRQIENNQRRAENHRQVHERVQANLDRNLNQAEVSEEATEIDEDKDKDKDKINSSSGGNALGTQTAPGQLKKTSDD